MEVYKEVVSLKTYTVDKKLLQAIEKYVNNKIPPLLNLKFENNNDEKRTLLSYGVININTSNGAKLTFKTIDDYDHDLFEDNICGIEFILAYEVKNDNRVPKLVIGIRMTKSKESNDLTIGVYDDSSKSKAIAIKQELLDILNRKRNLNYLLYPNDIISSALLAIVLIAVLLLFIVSEEKYKLYLSILLGVSLIYLFGLKYFKGYCSFDTNYQKRLDGFFKWFIVGLAGFILTSFLSSLRKFVFGF